MGEEPAVERPVVEPAVAEIRAKPEPGLGFERWMGFLSSFVAPLTLVTALLFYFGYVSTREFFRYFGIDVDLIGLSSQEFVMRSPGPLLVPVLVLLRGSWSHTACSGAGSRRSPRRRSGA